jgi:uncharacterized protein (TIGR02246 family)
MRRYRFFSLLLASALLAGFVAACSHPQPAAPPDTRVADEAAIRAADDAFTRFTAAKDLDKCMSDYMDDAVMFLPGAPAAVGKDNIRKVLQQMLAAPSVQMTFADQTVQVARSGELAVDRGSFQSTATDNKGRATTSTGKFILVWKKQADGSWKIAADTSATDK